MKQRNPYADLGLVIAVAVFIVVLIKCLIFGLSWASIACFLITIAYFVISAIRKSDDKVVKHSTTAYLLAMLLLVVSLVLFDKNARPKMHAFEGAAVDSVQEEEFVVEDKEIPIEIVQPDTAEVDTLLQDTTTLMDETESAEPIEDTEKKDVTEE